MRFLEDIPVKGNTNVIIKPFPVIQVEVVKTSEMKMYLDQVS